MGNVRPLYRAVMTRNAWGGYDIAPDRTIWLDLAPPESQGRLDWARKPEDVTGPSGAGQTPDASQNVSRGEP